MCQQNKKNPRQNREIEIWNRERSQGQLLMESRWNQEQSL